MADIRTNTDKETILSTCLAIVLTANRRRLEKLVEMAAPDVMIKALSSTITEMEQKGAISKFVRDLDGCSHHIWETCERRVGRGGKVFFHFELNEDAPINFFPQGKYGPFVSFEKKS